MKIHNILIILLILISSCIKTEERSPDSNIFKNDLPSGGPTIQISQDNIGKSIENIYEWLNNENHEHKVRDSIAWLQLETNVSIKQLEGLTAKELIDFSNQNKMIKIKSKN